MRRKTRKVKVGNIFIGGDAPVSVQGMAKVRTSDVKKLLKDAARMVKEGAELVRVSVLDEDDAAVLPIIRHAAGVPVVADIHYSHKLALLAVEKGADKIRINPGNMSREGVRETVSAAKDSGIPIRIGVNSGSVRMGKNLAESMVASALNAVELFESMNFRSIVVSLKTPSVYDTLNCYRRISALCGYPLHLGITEAGRGTLAESKSVLGIGMLLSEGIGDTIRVSLTEPAWKEIKAGRAILQALGVRRFEPEIISCPTCGRTQVDLFAVLAKVEKEIKKLHKRHPEAKDMKFAVMGCGVNGPGEARQADIGIAGGAGKFALFKKGVIIGTYREEAIVEKLITATEEMLKNPICSSLRTNVKQSR
jgi:(E)-4-hydroxy-3-methylbut-2-enyl-diphosphate synthase